MYDGKILDKKAFDEFLEMAFKYTGPPKYFVVLAPMTLPDGTIREPGHYRLTPKGYEKYDPEEPTGI